MGTEYRQGYCKDCEKRVRLERKGTSHILHLLLTVFTVGLWLLIWIGLSIKMGGWTCPQCGGKRVLLKRLFRALPKNT